MATPSFHELSLKFPALWDKNDFNYRDRSIRKKLISKLLKECNLYSETKLTEDDIKRKLNTLSRTLKRAQVACYNALMNVKNNEATTGSERNNLCPEKNRRKKLGELEEEKKQREKSLPTATSPSQSSSPQTLKSTSKGKQAEVKKRRKARATPSPTPSTSSWSGSNGVGSSKRGGGSKNTYRHYISSLGSSSSKDGLNPLHISQLVLPQCRFCAQFSMDCIDLCTGNGDSVKNNITIVFNEMSVVVDLNSRELPKTVCRQCDLNLQDMYKFVNQVHTAQASLIRVHENDERPVIKEELEEIEIDDSDDDISDNNEISTTNTYLNAMDDLKTVTETEIVPQNVLIPQRTVDTVQTMLIVKRTADGPVQTVLVPKRTVDGPVQTVLGPKRTVDGPVQTVVIPKRTVDGPVQTVLVPKRTVDGPVQTVIIPTDVESVEEKEADKLVIIESGNSKLVIDSDVVKTEGFSDVDSTNLSIPEVRSVTSLYRPSRSNLVSDSVTELAQYLFKKST